MRMINSGMQQAAAALADMPPVDAAAWKHTVAEARAELDAWQAEPPIFKDGNAKLNLWQVVRMLKQALPADTIVTNGAGNYATWAHRFWPYGGLRTQLAPTSGTMGYGVPAAVAASIVEQHCGKKRSVLNVAGDGDFLMNGQELATAVQYRVGVLFIVFNNGTYGTIRMHQEREFPARVSGTTLQNTHFDSRTEFFREENVKNYTADALGGIRGDVSTFPHHILWHLSPSPRRRSLSGGIARRFTATLRKAA